MNADQKKAVEIALRGLVGGGTAAELSKEEQNLVMRVCGLSNRPGEGYTKHLRNILLHAILRDEFFEETSTKQS